MQGDPFLRGSSMSVHRRPARTLTVAVALGALLVPAGSAAARGLPDRAVRQIEALQKVKASASPIQAKLDSRLLLEQQRRRSSSLTASAPKLRTGVKPSRAGYVRVDIRVSGSGAASERRLALAGAKVRYASASTQHVLADVLFEALDRIAGIEEVRHVAPPS